MTVVGLLLTRLLRRRIGFKETKNLTAFGNSMAFSDGFAKTDSTVYTLSDYSYECTVFSCTGTNSLMTSERCCAALLTTRAESGFILYRARLLFFFFIIYYYIDLGENAFWFWFLFFFFFKFTVPFARGKRNAARPPHILSRQRL